MTEHVDAERDEKPLKHERDHTHWLYNSNRVNNVLDCDIPFDERTMIDDDSDTADTSAAERAGGTQKPLAPESSLLNPTMRLMAQ